MNKMNKKFGFTGETRSYCDCVLRQIVALRDVGNVRAGDIGGWVEKEKNLSHDGMCWIGPNAIVCDNAKIFHDAQVFDKAVVRGSAQIFDNAQIYGNAIVYDQAHVLYKAQVYDKAQVYGHSVIMHNTKVYGDARVNGLTEVCGRSVVCGQAYVSGRALIDDQAVIKGDAVVRGNSLVGGKAKITGTAVIFGEASIKGRTNISRPDEWISFSNVGTDNATLTVYKTTDGELECTRGCFTGTLNQFRERSARVHSEHMQKEYELMLQVAEFKLKGE